MSYADDVRKYCKDNIIDPARIRGEKQIAIRAGDIHAAMGYKSRMPLKGMDGTLLTSLTSLMQAHKKDIPYCPF